MEKEARCRRGQGGHPGQAEEGAGRDCIGHLGAQRTRQPRSLYQAGTKVVVKRPGRGRKDR